MRKNLPPLVVLALCLLLAMSPAMAQLNLNESSERLDSRNSIGMPGDDEGSDESDDECDDECGDYPAPVARTGQVISYDLGDDGDLRNGVCWPSPRFTDNQDGTVTDHLTGLVWLQDATRFSSRGWNPALNASNNLADDGGALTDGSVAGDWRLPNNKEMRSLIDLGDMNPSLPLDHPFLVPAEGAFWTSTTAINNTGRAWTIEDGTMVNDPKGTSNLVWPVRDAITADLGPAPVARTGQTESYGNRDDGELQAGVEWPDPRFTDNLNGTVTDNLTGLIWLKDGTRFENLSFADALNACNLLADDGIDLVDGSLSGDWHLPNLWELTSLNDYSQIGPALPAGNPFIVVNADNFWTSSTSFENEARAWSVGMGIGKMTTLPKGGLNRAWPVRGCERAADDESDDEGDDEGDDNHDLIDWTQESFGFGGGFSDLMHAEASDEENNRTHRDRVRRKGPRPSRR